MKARRVVIDTNVLISAALSPQGTPAQLLRLVLQSEQLVFSEQTHLELQTRLYRPKFDRYITLDTRRRILHDIEASAHWVVAVPGPRRSRDVDDDKFIDAALAANAVLLATGDRDLLDVPTFNELPILKPTESLAWLTRP